MGTSKQDLPLHVIMQENKNYHNRTYVRLYDGIVAGVSRTCLAGSQKTRQDDRIISVNTRTPNHGTDTARMCSTPQCKSSHCL